MKVLLVNGSPHKNGCTHTALSLVGEELNAAGVETEEFWIKTKPIASCVSCMSCMTTGKCQFEDVVNEFTEKAKDFDAFVFGSPVHYAGISGSMSSFLGRAFFSVDTTEGPFAFKPAACIVTARRAGSTSALDILNKYPLYQHMPLIGSTYWNMAFGNFPEEIMKDEEGIQTMKNLGKNMAYELKLIEAGEKAGIEKPKLERVAQTNVIR